ncbi:MAG: pilus assembly protein [Granulosicoccus sp.]
MKFAVKPGKLKSCTQAFAIILGLSSVAQADDIDVYTAKIAALEKPNVLFILDYSGSMGWDIYGGNAYASGNPARIDILKDAMAEVLERNFDRINAGIGSLYSSTTSGIRWPISELNADASTVDPAIPAGQFTVRDIILQQVNERGADGWTATVDALVEAAQYFRGDPVTHNDEGRWSPTRNMPHRWNTQQRTYTGGNALAAIAPSYSPSNAYDSNRRGTFFCNNYAISGGPNYCEGKWATNCEMRTSDDAKTPGFDRLDNLWGNYQRCQYTRSSAWVGARYNSPIARTCQSNTIVLISDGQPTKINDGASLRSIVGTSARGCEDLSNTVFAGSSRRDAHKGNCGLEVLRSLSGGDLNPDIPDSHVRTYAVGFNITGPGQNYLRLLADAGEGEYFQANQPEELSQALENILDEILGSSENFSELSVDVDRANFSHGSRAYLGLFTPSIRRSWPGNLKGYFVDSGGLQDIHGDPATMASDTGLQFRDSAQSFWSTDRDGNEVSAGGASEQLAQGNRRLFTYTGEQIPAQGVALRGPATTRLQKSNSSITNDLMGLSNNSASRDAALDWIQTAPMGDPLHTKSVTVNYGDRQVVFISTNQGLLHAFDATRPVTSSSDSSGGDEIFAFMPKRLLKNLPDLHTNTNNAGHIYGLDGAITRWHSDTDNDGVVDSGEDVLLIVGMRRGGSAYYAMDISNPDFPRLAWMIDDDNPDFPELAQSWSRMSLVNVNDGGTTRQVLAFAAGYDAGVQDQTTRPTTSSGNAIYMIDRSGNLVWKAGISDHPDMAYSIPSDLTIIDSDGDKTSDRLYVGDVAGQVWRVDFTDIRSDPDVTLLAELDDGEHQPFFYPPSVSLNSSATGRYLAVAIGSGNRTDPLLEGVQNNIYMIRDTDIRKGPPDATLTTVTSDALYDASNNNIESTDDTTRKRAQDGLKAARGWKIALRPGEKALSSLLTFEGKLMATTFQANLDSAANPCGFDTTGRFYVMDIQNAMPRQGNNNLNQTNTDEDDPRSSELNSQAIPSSPIVVFPKDASSVQVFVDKESVDTFNQSMTSVFWHAK